MKKVVFAVVALLMCNFSVASSYEFLFDSSSSYSGAIPNGWELTGNGAISLMVKQPATPSGSEESGLGINVIFASGQKCLRTVSPVIDSSKIKCDLVSASIRAYMQTPTGAGRDTFQIVISTDNWNTYQEIGTPIEIEETGRTVNEWKTVTRRQLVNGLSALGKDISVGVVIKADNTTNTGYLKSITLDFLAVATPEEVCFKVGDRQQDSFLPGETGAYVSTIINPYPLSGDGAVTVNNVYCDLNRNGVISRLQMVKDDSSGEWRTAHISPAIDAGEVLKATVYTEYSSTLDTIVDKVDGVAKESSTSKEVKGAMSGSVWINELFSTGLVELCGSVTRTMLPGWRMELVQQVAIVEGEEPLVPKTYIAQLGKTFNFKNSLLVNNTVGLETRNLEWKDSFGNVVTEIPDGAYTLKLLNSRGVAEHTEIVTLPIENSVGMKGVAVWPVDGELCDWSGTSSGGIFTWGDLSSSTTNKVNEGQGFKVEVSAIVKIKTKAGTGGDASPVPYATVVATVNDFGNNTEAESQAVFKGEAIQNEDGGDAIAIIGINGYFINTNNIPVNISANAFGWYGEDKRIYATNGEEIEEDFVLTPTIAEDSFTNSTINSWWSNIGSLSWKFANDANSGRKPCLRTDTMFASKGSSVLKCSNFVSSHGKSYASVAFDFMDNSQMIVANQDYFSVQMATNQNWEGVICTNAPLSNKRSPLYNQFDWYRHQAIYEMPKGFADAKEIWLRLICDSDGGTYANTCIKNLCIAFQDMATVKGLRWDESVEKPSFEIDVKPWCGEGQSVSNVTAQLVMDVNGKVFTNEVAAVNLAEDWTFTITNINENLKANVGYAPLRAKDKVKYWAQVKYFADSLDPDPAKEWETKFYPDNSKVDSEGRWVVEGEYGVDMAKVESENTFTVPGDPVTQNEEFVPTESEVSFGVRVYDAAGVSNVVVKVFAEGSEEPIDVRTFDVEGMVTHYDTVINLSGLNSNTKYIVKVSGWNANGEEIAEQVLSDSFTTLPAAPIVDITALSANEVKMEVKGFAAGFKISDSDDWTPSDSNTWTKVVNTGANSLVSATVTATNALGGASKPTTAEGYTKAAIATMAPVVETDKNWAIVKACTNHYASVDGNPDYTEYALRVTTSKGSTNDVEVWKPLAAWQDTPEKFTKGVIDLTATNTFSFITRNCDGAVTTNDSPATAECWFDMTVSFEGNKATQSDDGSLAFMLNFFDPAQSEEATATIEYMIGDGEWQLIKAPYTVKFDDLEVKENIVFNAKDVVGDVNEELEYTIRATITDGERSASSTITGKLDFKKPEVLNLSTESSLSAFNTDELNVILEFSEPVVGFSTGSVNVGNATVLTVKPSIVTNVYTVVLKPTAEGVVTVSVPEGTVADIYGNVNLASGVLTTTYDITAPKVTLTTDTPKDFNDATMAVKVAFSEPVIDFTADKISVLNCTVSNLTKLDDAENTYLATITPNLDGVVSVNIMSGKVKDAAGNGNNESNIITCNYDTTRPTVELSSETPDLFNNTKSPMVVTATFSEAVVGVNNEAITVENAASYELSGTNDTYTITIVPEVDGKVVVKIDENKVTDLALNGNIASNGLVREYDNTSPVINSFASDPADGAETNNNAFNYSVEATDANEITYSWSLITPNGSELKGSEASFSGEAQEEGWYNLSVTVSDAVGNITSRTARWRYDITAPTVALTSETPDPFNTSPMTVKVVFSEDVVGFTHEDLDVTNATIDESSLKTIDDGTNTYYLVTLNPVADGEVTLVINEGVATDKAGNNNTAATITRKYDNTKPTVELTSDTPNPFNEKSPFVVTVTFSEPITGFNEASLNVVNASSYTVSGEGDTYTITIEPAANDEITGQAVSVEVLDSVVTDAAGNKNDKSATLTRTYDIVKPVVTLTSETPEYFNADAAPMTVKVVFTEAVTNFTWESVSVTNGTVDENSFESVVDGTNTYYLVTVTPVADGEVTLAVNEGVVADSAGNINTSATLTRVYDTASPAPVLTSITPDPFNNESSPLTVTVIFNESIIGFGEESVKVDNGTINEITGAEAVYTVKVDPPAEDGYVSISIPSNVVRDAAGNWNTGSEVLTRLYDNARPEVTLTTDTPNPFNADEAFVVKFAFSEVVTNFTENLISVTNGKATFMEPIDGEANSYLVTIEPESDGVVSVEVADGVALDRAGNGNIASAVLSRRYDNTRPELTLASESPEYVNAETSPIVFTATFNESITDLLTDGIIVDNGEVLEIAKSETITNTFVVTINALNEGMVTVKIAEDAVKDMANNSNNASEELSWIYDITRPTVELTSETPNPFNEKSPFVVTAKFSEPVTGFNEASLNVVNASSYTVSGEGDTYTITVEPAANEEITGQAVTVEVLDSVVTDAAGNKNDKSAPLTRTYDIVEPDVTFTTETPDDFVFNAAYTYKVTVAFNESVTNFTADTVSVVNGTVSEYSKVEDAENTFIVTIAPESDGEVKVQVNEGVVADAAGNGNNASEVLVRKCDITKPVASIKSFAFDPKTVYISFDEDVVGLTKNSIIVENGTIDIYRANGENGAIITVNSLSDGIVTIKIPEGAVTDKVGNANAAVEAYVNDNTPPTKPIISGSPENGATVNESGFSLKAVATDNSPADMLTYFWSLNGGALVKNKTGILTGESIEGENVVQVYVMDLSGNKSEIASWRWIYEKKTTDVEFGDSVRLAVDPETGATNTVSFTKLELGSDYCTLTLSGFDADSTEILDLEMWLIVSDTIEGKPWYIKVNSEAKFDTDKNELIVTIPQSAIKDDEDKVYDSLFFLGVDNSNLAQ